MLFETLIFQKEYKSNFSFFTQLYLYVRLTHLKTKCLNLIGEKRYNASKTSYCAEKRAINNAPTVDMKKS